MSGMSETTREREVVLADRIEKVATGQATIADAAGITKKQLYEIAEKGHSLFNQGRLEDARGIFEGLVAASPFDSVFHCHLGAILWRSGDLEGALREYDASVRFNVANVDALAGRGELLIARGELEKGVDDLSRALEFDPDGARPATKRVRVLLVSLHESAKRRKAA